MAQNMDMHISQRIIRGGFKRVCLAALILFLSSACSGSMLESASPPGAVSTAAAVVGRHSPLPGVSPTLYILMLDHNTPSPTLTPPASTKTRPPASPTFTATVPAPSPTSTPDPTPTSKPTFVICSPLVSHTIQELTKIISDPYDPPKSWSSDARHQGVDFSYHHWKQGGSILGVGVQSVLAGRVSASLADTYPYGNLVIIETPYEDLPQALIEGLKIGTGKSLYHLYAHLQSEPLVNLGDEVSACQLLGAVGRSGNAEVAHLHFETRLGPPGASFTCMSRFVEGATAEEKANYVLWRTSGLYRHFDPMTLLLFDLGGQG
jgi:murein DD-endopeptidase MepM/ murein hydrolase activator NlpD